MRFITVHKRTICFRHSGTSFVNRFAIFLRSTGALFLARASVIYQTNTRSRKPYYVHRARAPTPARTRSNQSRRSGGSTTPIVVSCDILRGRRRRRRRVSVCRSGSTVEGWVWVRHDDVKRLVVEDPDAAKNLHARVRWSRGIRLAPGGLDVCLRPRSAVRRTRLNAHNSRPFRVRDPKESINFVLWPFVEMYVGRLRPNRFPTFYAAHVRIVSPTNSDSLGLCPPESGVFTTWKTRYSAIKHVTTRHDSESSDK